MCPPSPDGFSQSPAVRRDTTRASSPGSTDELLGPAVDFSLSPSLRADSSLALGTHEKGRRSFKKAEDYSSAGCLGDRDRSWGSDAVS